MLYSLDDYQKIPEDDIKRQAEATGSKNLWKLLSIADQWRDAGCTPVFILVSDQPNKSIIGCVSEETFSTYIN